MLFLAFSRNSSESSTVQESQIQKLFAEKDKLQAELVQTTALLVELKTNNSENMASEGQNLREVLTKLEQSQNKVKENFLEAELNLTTSEFKLIKTSYEISGALVNKADVLTNSLGNIEDLINTDEILNALLRCTANRDRVQSSSYSNAFENFEKLALSNATIKKQLENLASDLSDAETAAENHKNNSNEIEMMLVENEIQEVKEKIKRLNQLYLKNEHDLTELEKKTDGASHQRVLNEQVLPCVETAYDLLNSLASNKLAIILKSLKESEQRLGELMRELRAVRTAFVERGEGNSRLLDALSLELTKLLEDKNQTLGFLKTFFENYKETAAQSTHLNEANLKELLDNLKPIQDAVYANFVEQGRLIETSHEQVSTIKNYLKLETSIEKLTHKIYELERRKDNSEENKQQQKHEMIKKLKNVYVEITSRLNIVYTELDALLEI